MFIIKDRFPIIVVQKNSGKKTHTIIAIPPLMKNRKISLSI